MIRKLFIILCLVLLLSSCSQDKMDIVELEESYSERFSILSEIITNYTLEDAEAMVLFEDNNSIIFAFKSEHKFDELKNLHEDFDIKIENEEIGSYLHQASSQTGDDENIIVQTITIKEDNIEVEVMIINNVKEFEKLGAKPINISEIFDCNVLIIITDTP